jgi:hypothetical protein
LLPLAGCDSGENFTYKNESGEALFVRANEGSNNRIDPGETRTITHLTSEIGRGDDPLHFVVTDDRGCVVLVRETTLDEFKEEQDLTFVLRPDDLLPLDLRTDCGGDSASTSRVGQSPLTTIGAGEAGSLAYEFPRSLSVRKPSDTLR